MDLSTGHMAYTTHIQDARRAEREREYRRVAEERADAAATVSGGSLAAPPAASTAPAPTRWSPISALFRGHRATAQ